MTFLYWIQCVGRFTIKWYIEKYILNTGIINSKLLTQMFVSMHEGFSFAMVFYTKKMNNFIKH